MYDMLAAWATTQELGLQYAGAIVADPGAELLQVMQLLNLPWKVLNSAPPGCTIVSKLQFREAALAHAPMHVLQQRVFQATTPHTAGRQSIVVHMHRGENAANPQVGDYFVDLPTAYYLDQIRLALDQAPSAQVAVITTATPEDLAAFAQAGYSIHSKQSLPDVWRSIMLADVTILSRSLLSYVPALFSKGKVVYQPCGLEPQPSWQVVNSTLAALAPAAAALAANTPVQNLKFMREQQLPCDEAPTPQVHVSVLNANTTERFQHFAHAAMTLLPCWQWFLSSPATSCAFLLEQGLPENVWAESLVQEMGCSIIVEAPKQCAVLGRWKIKRGLALRYDWVVRPGAASVLRESMARRHVFDTAGSGQSIGLLQRNRTRQLLVQSRGNSSAHTPLQGVLSTLAPQATVTSFEGLTFLEQAAWMYKHDIILMAHGAAVTNTIFMRPCSVLVQFYSNHYYPLGFYEPMISAVGVVPITWYPNKNMTADPMPQDAAALQEHALHGKTYAARKRLRALPVVLTKDVLHTTLDIAVQSNLHCRWVRHWLQPQL